MIRHSGSRSSLVLIYLISFIVFILPFSNILYLPFPIEFLGKNLWLVIPVLLTLIVYISTLFKGCKGLIIQATDIAVLMLALMGTMILGVREVLYEDRQSYIDVQYLLMPIIVLLVFERIAEEKNKLHLPYWILISVCVIQALLGIIHAHLFSGINIYVNPDNVKDMQLIMDGERTREGGTLGASIFANLIICGMFLIASIKEKHRNFSKSTLVDISMFIMLYAVTLSGSRYPIAVAILLTIVHFIKGSSKWLIYAILIAAVTSAITIVGNQSSLEFLGILRFDEDSGGRQEKLILGYSLLSGNDLHLLVGAPSALVESTTSADGEVAISDNSYVHIALQFGVVLLMVWVTFFTMLLKRHTVDIYSFCFVLYFLVAIGLTNGILWSVWIFSAMLTLILMRHGRMPVSA